MDIAKWFERFCNIIDGDLVKKESFGVTVLECYASIPILDVSTRVKGNIKELTLSELDPTTNIGRGLATHFTKELEILPSICPIVGFRSKSNSAVDMSVEYLNPEKIVLKIFRDRIKLSIEKA